MLQSYGGIIKLNRIKQNIKQDYICYKTGISKSHLSRMERNIDNISDNTAKMIFESIDLNLYCIDINDDFERDFIKFYEDIVFLRDFEYSFSKIKYYYPNIQTSLSYVKYLLAEMIYTIMKSDNNNIYTYLFLEDFFDYLEPYQIQIFYDCLGLICYDNKKYSEALSYYSRAEQFNGNDLSKSMLYYHISISAKHLRELSLALQFANKAKELCFLILNLKRLLYIMSHIANIESDLKNYHKSEIINLQCINALKDLNMNENIIICYNNLLWTYILWSKYKKVIDLEKEIIDITNSDHCICFYLSFSYHKLGNDNQARKYIQLAKTNLKKPTNYMKTMIHSFSIYLSNASLAHKENSLLKIYDAAIKSNDKNIEIFILNFIVDFYKENQIIDKAFLYQEKLLTCYKETN